MPSETVETVDGVPASGRIVVALRHVDLLICAGLVFASLLVGAVHVPQHAMISPIDEYVYIDAVAKVPTQGGVIRRGEEVGDFARRYLACHSVWLVANYPASLCAAPDTEEDAAYPMGGVTSADIYTPVYFATTWLLAQPLTWFGVDLVSAARFVGALWLALAAVALYLALRRLLVPRMLASSLPLLLTGSLPAFWSNTFISTDATAFAAGAVLLLIGLRVRDGVSSPWWLVALSVLFTAFKLQNLLALAAVGVFLMLTAVARVRNLPRGARFRSWLGEPLVWGTVLAVVASAVVQVAWIVIRPVIAVGPPVEQGADSPLTALALVKELFKFIPGIATGATSLDHLGIHGVLIAGTLSLIVAGGVVGSIGADKGLSTTSNLGVAVLGVAMVSAPVLGLLSASISGEFVVLVARYGLSLLPLALACAGALFAERRWLHVPFLVIAVGLYVLSLRIGG